MSKRKSNPRRHRSPSLLANPAHHHQGRCRNHVRLHNAHRRARNPMSLALPVRELLPVTGFAILGGVAARAIPEKLIPNSNTGIMGYGANAATTLILGWLAERVSKSAGIGVLIGGSVMTAARIISDLMGQPIVTFADSLSSTSSLSGDPAFHLGSYAPSYFPIPGQSAPVGDALMVSSNPNIQSVAPAAIVKTNKGQTAVLALPKSQPAASASAMAGMGFSPRFKPRFAS